MYSERAVTMPTGVRVCRVNVHTFLRQMWRRTLAAAAASATTCAAIVGAGKNSSGSDGSSQLARVVERKEIAKTRFISLQSLSYLDATGCERKWDMASRTTKKDGEPDGVAILALLRSRAAADVEMLLVQQFRPPVNALTIELPAGLIDPGESAETAAVRELKEETGYEGTVVLTSQVLAMSPGMCDEMIRLCVVDVDLDAPPNRTPRQQLEESEFIKVHRVPIKQLLTRLKAMEGDGLMPIGGLFLLATGLAIGQAAGSGSQNLHANL